MGERKGRQSQDRRQKKRKGFLYLACTLFEMYGLGETKKIVVFFVSEAKKKIVVFLFLKKKKKNCRRNLNVAADWKIHLLAPSSEFRKQRRFENKASCR